MARTVSIALDDELYIRIEHAMRAEAVRLGVGRVAKSVFLRELIARGIDDPRPPFSRGWLEGYRTAFAAAMRYITTALSELGADPSKQLPGIHGIGMSSPYDERGDDE